MLKPSLISLSAVVVLNTASLATNVVLARALGADGRGVYAAALLIASLASGLAQLGFGQAFVFQARFHSDGNLRRLVTYGAAITALMSLLIALGMTTLNPTMSAIYTSHAAWIAVATSVVTLVAAMSQIDPTLAAYNVIRVSTPCVFLISALSIWSLESLDAHAALVMQGSISSAVAIAAFIWLIRCTGRHDATQISLKQTASLGLKYHATTTLGLITGNIDKVALLVVGNLSSLGLYSIAIASARVIGAVQESVSNALFAAHAGKKGVDLPERVLASFRITFYPLILIAALLSLLSGSLIPLMFGAEFKSAAIPFSILCFESVIGSSSWLVAQYHNAIGRPGVVAIRQICALVPVVVFLPFLPNEHTLVWLGLLLLFGSSVRLVVSIYLFVRDTGTPLKSFIASRCDTLAVTQLILSKVNR